MKQTQTEEEHVRMLRPYLPECMVLLKKSGAFPLEAPGPIALYGSGARHTLKGGTGSGEVNSRTFTTVEEGLSQAGFEITTKNWMDAYDRIIARAQVDFTKEIRRRAREHHTLAVLEGMGLVMPEPDYELPLDGEGDTALYVLSRNSGEGNDRALVDGDIFLSRTEKRDIRTLQKKYKKFLLVLNVGGPVDLSPVPEVENILVLSQLGVETGAALADVLLGKAYPSGKLTTTWPAGENCRGIGEFGDRFDTRYREGVYVGYRCFDTAGVKPLYPFGFGLGYTMFSVTCDDLSLKKDEVTVTVTVKNTGSCPGKEVVQAYLSCPDGKLDRPYQELAGWVKTQELAAGQSFKGEISFHLADLAAYDEEKAQYILEAGEYGVWVGTSSAETSCAGVIVVKEETVVRQAANLFGKTDFTDWKPETPRKPACPPEAKRIPLAAEAITMETVDYDPEVPEADPFVKGLSLEELAYANVGGFDPRGGPLSIIGDASRSVSGAAGESYDGLKEKGMPVLVMSDGPAGLRLSKDYVIDKKGATHAVGSTMPATIANLMPRIVTWFMEKTAAKPGKGQEVHHYYMTAIPIGTAIAQSWNLRFGQLCGDIVGAEMEEVGVHLWLAPALNIHRTIRCGRNFEYYSEDPLVSGSFAAAVTEGVQSHRGCGTTIKHLAANNQETNRSGSNSMVSERALREIYLKGFGICIRKAQPEAVMTSYNLLNGTHTSERRDLIEGVIRREYGFKGIVMTDWIVEQMSAKDDKYPKANAGKIAAAGGDLVMPGCKKNVDDILAAVKDGSLSREQLEQNVTRVVRMAKKLAGT